MLLQTLSYPQVVEEICDLRWSDLSRDDLLAVSEAYYYFSVQFREAVEIACETYPGDHKLTELRDGECDTNNLSPYPGVAEPKEKMNHDEFMRRVLAMSSIDPNVRAKLKKLGAAYLAQVRQTDPATLIMSLPSYEDGGLERVFSAMLLARDWEEPSLKAFQHFLVGHVRLDSDPDAGHGALCRHLVPDDRILPLWNAFRDILVEAAPILAN